MYSNTTAAQKTYAVRSQTVAMREGGVLSWLITDHLGSINVTANADGTLQSEMRYAAFGETRYTNGVTPSDYRYTGQLSQAELGLYFYSARWYDPQLGRFVQADTVVPGAGNTKAYDRYAYVLNNPINLNDPSGHIPPKNCEDSMPGGCGSYNIGGTTTTTTGTSTITTTGTSSSGNSAPTRSVATVNNNSTYTFDLSENRVTTFGQAQTSGTNCGPFALAMTISLCSQQISGKQVEDFLVYQGFKNYSLGILGPGLAAGANLLDPKHDYIYQKGGTIQDLINNVDADRPTIVGWSNETNYQILFETPVRKILIGHWVVVVGYDIPSTQIIILNPAGGNRERISYSDFNQRWNLQSNIFIGNGDMITPYKAYP